MSNAALNAVWSGSQSRGAARLVLLAMADEANDEGYLTAYRRSQAHLGQKANLPERTVRRAIADLVSTGEVEILAPGSGRQQSDYLIRLPGLHAGPPTDRRGGPDLRPREDTTSGPGRTPRPDQGGRHVRTREDAMSSPSSPSTPYPPSTPSPHTPQGSLLPVPAAATAVTYASARGHDLGFEAFWDAYPRKVGKVAARKAWAAALRRAPDEVIVAGALRYAADPNRDPEYTAHPTTWLNRGSWDDDPLPARGGRRDANRTERALSRMAGGRPVERPDLGAVFGQPSRKALGA